MGIFSNLFRRLKKKSVGRDARWCSYLEKHDYYTDPGERGSYGKFPRLPYSLGDLLGEQLGRSAETKVFVCSHGSSAHWFARNGANVVIGRACRSKSNYQGITYLPEWRSYSANDLDVLLLDSHQMMIAGELLLPHLSARGVVIVSHMGMGRAGMNAENRRATESLYNRLLSEKWKKMRFVNPAPGIGELTADLWYRQDNFLNI